ncbi:MAG: molybdopterin-dependent oxidoreductase [Hyphomicrobiaceae bacterium]|nr:molybdopterin-dependent oxidoreductase [Hyphomicrobiaceae bacterium]
MMDIDKKLRDGGLAKGDVVDLRRRLLLRNGLGLGAATLLAGCDGITNTSSVDRFLRAISRFNDNVQANLFSPHRLAPTFHESLVAPEFRFNAQYGEDRVPLINPATWRLKVSGRVTRNTPWTLDELKALPQRADVTRHVCVEGWSMIGKWGGVPLRTFLERSGADLKARYVAFHCDDPIAYRTSIDMATALHPQTILCLTYADKPIAPKFGAPMRVKIPTKLGFKQPKFVVEIHVTDEFPSGYWEDYGYNWFAGL